MFLKQFVRGLVGTGDAPVTHADEVEIENALEAMMKHIDKPDRRLSTLMHSLPNPFDPEQTHPTVAAQRRRRLDEKHRRSETKSGRRRPTGQD